MGAEQQIWTEKYRPKDLSSIVGQKEIVARLKAFVREKNIPHMLFAGQAGIGKTTAALALARELFGEGWKDNFMETNASDDRGIDIVRKRIKDFARTRAMGGSFKIIFLDECDALTKDAQNALRRTMENYTSTCRFVLSCNYSSKIIPPLQSRCAIFRFKGLRPEDVSSYIERIAKGEKMKLDKDAKDGIIAASEGDLRKVTNILQAAGGAGSHVTKKSVLSILSKISKNEGKKIVQLAAGGRFLDARKELSKLMIEEGISGEEIIGSIHKAVLELDIDDRKRIELIEKVGEADFRMLEGANEVIQLEALLARIATLGGSK